MTALRLVKSDNKRSVVPSNSSNRYIGVPQSHLRWAWGIAGVTTLTAAIATGIAISRGQKLDQKNAEAHRAQQAFCSVLFQDYKRPPEVIAKAVFDVSQNGEPLCLVTDSQGRVLGVLRAPEQ